MLAGERAGLGQAGVAAQFGCRRDTGPPLFLGQGLAILPGGGAELRSPVTLDGGAGASRFDIQAPPLLCTPHISGFLDYQHEGEDEDEPSPTSSRHTLRAAR